MLACVLAFLSGAIYEGACVLWVHLAERNRAGRVALLSAVVATCQVFGIGESVRHLRAAPFFVVGYALGAYGAMKLKTRWGTASGP